MKLNSREIKSFQRAILTHYKKEGRRFPWRETHNPWKILVSEIMLQQTQTERVIPFFRKFVKDFPTPVALANASLKRVLVAWQGLGYNRRALLLKRAAEMIVRDFGGEVPSDLEQLDALPGIGPYTAGAIMAFAFDRPAVFIETNIRTVFLHFFFKDRKKVNDKEILRLIEQTPPYSDVLENIRMSPREWYSALMDYGAHLKETIGNQSAAKSIHYVKQSTFKDSRRQLRAKILRCATREGRVAARDFNKESNAFSVSELISELVSEGFLKKSGMSFILQS